MSKVAIYARLSREDEDKIDGNKESRSIENQINVLTEYAIKNDYEIHDIYYDDGYSGANINRPELTRLINDAKKKKFNILLVKDISRLGRTLHHVGDLIENVFPSLNIRVIAINDNYDSSTYIDEESIVLRTFLNAYYLKDFKRKINQSLVHRAKTKILKTHPKYGYEFDENKNIIIDEYAANIVRRIFNEYVSGKQPKLIAEDLNKDNIPTKSTYLNSLTDKKYYSAKDNKWKIYMITTTVSDIEYIGTLVNLSTSKKHDIVMMEGKIPRIIDKEIFTKAQEIKATRKYEKDKEPNLCKLLYDGDSNTHPKISRTKVKKIRYYNFSKQHIDLNKTIIDKLIFDDVIHLIKDVLKNEDKQYKYYKESLLSKNTSNKEELTKQLNKYNQEYSLLLEQMFEEKISDFVFKRKSETLQKKINDIEQQLKEHQSFVAKIKMFDKKFKQFLDDIKRYKVDYDLINLIISKIHVYKVGGHSHNWQIKIKITYNFEEI